MTSRSPDQHTLCESCFKDFVMGMVMMTCCGHLYSTNLSTTFVYNSTNTTV